MTVTTRNQDKRKAANSKKRNGTEESVKKEEPPQKEQKKEHHDESEKKGSSDDKKHEDNSYTPKMNNSNAIAKNEKNQPLLDKLDELADAMFYAENAESKNHFKGIAIKRAVNALAKLDFAITSGDSVFKGNNKIAGVGEGTAAYIDEFIETGDIKEIRDYAKLGEQAKANESKKKESPKPVEESQTKNDGGDYDEEIVEINRAPVLTLWATVVAQREGFSRREALTYGKWIATVFAQSKGRALGKFDTSKGPPAEEREAEHVRAFGDKKIPVSKDSSGDRLALQQQKTVDPTHVQEYLQQKFGNKLMETEAAMKELADNMDVEELKESAYDLYTQIRPEWKGWGKKAAMNLSEIRQIAHQMDS